MCGCIVIKFMSLITERKYINTNGVELIWVEIKMNKKKIFIVNIISRPPNSSVDYGNWRFEKLRKAMSRS